MGNFKRISINNLVPDELNKEAWLEDDIKPLAECIRKNGFFGTIVAYEIGDGKYRIESGHRRFEAAKAAGIDYVDIQVSNPPKDDIERRKRLTQWNLHGRKVDNPVNMAKAAQFLYETYEKENRELKKDGKETFPILERVASDLECSISNVVKYKSLLSLIPELQELAGSGNYSWAAICKASALEKDQQEYLYKRICGQGRAGGPGMVTGDWIEKEIKYLKHYKFTPADSYKYDRNWSVGLFDDDEIRDEEPEIKSKRKRRRDCYKNIVRSRDFLKKATEKTSLLKKSDKEAYRNIINEMKKYIEEAEKNLEL